MSKQKEEKAKRGEELRIAVDQASMNDDGYIISLYIKRQGDAGDGDAECYAGIINQELT